MPGVMDQHLSEVHEAQKKMCSECAKWTWSPDLHKKIHQLEGDQRDSLSLVYPVTKHFSAVPGEPFMSKSQE